MATEKTDVVIVGMGAVGGILAAELGKAGMKVIGLERGPRLTTADFNPHDELRYFQRQDLRPNWKRQPVTWRPNASAARAPDADSELRQSGGRRHGPLRHALLAHARGRFPRALANDRALRRLGHSGGFLARRLAAYLRRSRAVLRSAPNTSWAFPARRAICRAARSTAATCSKPRATAIIRFRRCLMDQSGVLFAEGARKLGYHPFSSPRAIISQPYHDRAELHLLRLLPVVRLPRRREVEHPGHQAARGGRHRQFQIAHRRDVLPREYRQQRARHRRVLLRSRRLGQHDRSGDR